MDLGMSSPSRQQHGGIGHIDVPVNNFALLAAIGPSLRQFSSPSRLISWQFVRMRAAPLAAAIGAMVTGNDGREMVRAIADHRISLLDVMLPGEDGLSLYRKVHAEPRSRSSGVTYRNIRRIRAV
jgi:CheY-like chemotaxis protein